MAGSGLEFLLEVKSVESKIRRKDGPIKFYNKLGSQSSGVDYKNEL